MSSAMALCVLLSNFSSFLATSRFKSLDSESRRQEQCQQQSDHSDYLQELFVTLTNLAFWGRGWPNPADLRNVHKCSINVDV